MEGVTYRRGEVVTCAPPGDFGKPRPALVLQSDLFNETHASVTVCPLTTHGVQANLFRITVKPSASNGLRRESQAMADKLTTLRRERVGAVIGQIDADDLAKIEAAVVLWLGLKA